MTFLAGLAMLDSSAVCDVDEVVWPVRTGNAALFKKLYTAISLYVDQCL